MDTPTILTIEDDTAIRRGVVDVLQYAGYRVLQTGDGSRGLELALTCAYDLLLLDLALPGLGGLEILQRVRQARPTQSIIILTAKGEEQDRVGGLRGGADDYVVKPFSPRELLARVEAVLRRAPQRPRRRAHVPIPGGQADLERREIRFADDERIELSERETELLQYLAEHCGRVVSRDELLANVWGISPQRLTTRTIDMHVARLREKLRDNLDHPRVLITVRGKGYTFNDSAT